MRFYSTKIFSKIKRYQIILAAVLLVVLGLGGIGRWMYMRPFPLIRPSLATPEAAKAIVPTPNLAWSPYGEQAFQIVGQPLSGTQGAESPLPTASIAKVMTALAILHQKPLNLGEQGPVITITAADVAVYQQDLSQNQSVVSVTAGETLTEYQALQAMLIPSATNIADIMASWAFGSLSNYLAYANSYAQQLGMTSTQFVDASGFLPGTVSTPQDLIKLGIVAMQNPVIAQIVGQNTVTLPVAGTVANFDTALGTSGIIGIKTGNTDEAGGAFLYAAKYNGQLIVGATLGAPDLGTTLHDAPELVASVEQSFQTDTVVRAGEVVGRYTLPWGGSVNAVAEKKLSIIDWPGTLTPVKVALKPLTTTSVVGSASFAYNGSTHTTLVKLAGSYAGPSFWWRLFR
jgi:D-alanyl-D-alanine carboxypeptidase (penicillin-binding protein 5/6)